MPITKTENYSGTVEGFAMFKGYTAEKEYEEVIGLNEKRQQTRQMVETGGLILTFSFEVKDDKGNVIEERITKGLVTAAQMEVLTFDQVIEAAAIKLRASLGV